MREIKFRAWNTIDRKMLKWSDIFHLPAWEIFPGTPEQRAFDIMQYTGLKDKSGKEIYEGDIVRYEDTHGEEQINTVEYNLEYGAFCFDRGVFVDTLNCAWEIEVIGNIYENPELIGAKNGN